MENAIIDLDGTVYRSRTVIPGAREGIERLRDRGLDVVFVTNSSTKTRETCRDRLASLGIEAAVDDILTSASVTAAHVTREYPTASVLTIGSPALDHEFSQADGTLTEDPTEADVLVVGKDRSFDFETLTRGLRALESGAIFIGTNEDRKVPTDSGMIPGCGALIAALNYAANQDPDQICGKPHDPMIEVSLDRLAADPADCLVIGDNPETDIEMGRRAGMTTVLVLTGLVDRSDPLLADEPADHMIDSLEDLSTLL